MGGSLHEQRIGGFIRADPHFFEKKASRRDGCDIIKMDVNLPGLRQRAKRQPAGGHKERTDGAAFPDPYVCPSPEDDAFIVISG